MAAKNVFLLSIILCGYIFVLCDAWPSGDQCPCRCGLAAGPQLTHALGPGSYRQVDCTYQNLHTIPMNIPVDTEVLLLANNYITSITEENFSSFRELKYLDLSHNFLSAINGQTFKVNVQLKMLNLNWNQIRQIANDAFLAIDGLSRLLLSGNQLTVVPDALQNLIHLILLELSNNAIQNIHSHNFDGMQNLQFLNLRENAIDVIAPLGITNLQSLVSLQLSGNILSNISYTSFHNLPRLSSISLGYNALANLPTNLFKNVPNTEKIDLKGNQIFQLPPNIFHGLPHLTEIDLEENSLHDIPPNIFHGLTNLRRIALQGNEHLTSIPNGLFDGLTNLETLSLSHLQEIPENFFSPTPSLTRLSITDTSLSRIPRGLLFNLTNLEIIELADNRIDYISPGAFETQENLRILDISGNRLRSITEGIFTGDLYSLQDLYLQENRIIRLFPGAFSELQSLRTLVLETNRIQEIQPGVFPTASSFRNLQLAENPIQRIDGIAFQTLMDLTLLTLDSTELICDCQLSHFVDWLKLNRAIVDAASDLSCGAPWMYHGAPVTRFLNRPRALNCRFPMIRTFPHVQNLTSEVGHNLTLPCLLDESSIATLSWDLDGHKSLYLSSVFREPQTSDNHLLLPSGTLMIFNASASDNGIYTCIASNAAGADTVTYYINIPFINITSTTETPTTTVNVTQTPPVTTPPSVTKRIRTIPPRFTIAARPHPEPITVTKVATTQKQTTTKKRVTTQEVTLRPPTTNTITTHPPQTTKALTLKPTTSQATTQPRQQPTTVQQKARTAPTTKSSHITVPRPGDGQPITTIATLTMLPTQGGQVPTSTPPPPASPNICSPNPCLHGGICAVVPIYDSSGSIEMESRESFSSSEDPYTDIPQYKPKCACRNRYGGPLCNIRKPDNPVGVDIMEKTGKVITLKWSNKNTAQVEGYRIVYSLLGDSNIVKTIPIHPDVSSYTMSQLKQDATYRVCVVAFNNAGESTLGESNCLWARTNGAGKSQLTSDFFTMEMAFIGGGVIFILSLLLLTVVCYSRTKREREYHKSVVRNVAYSPEDHLQFRKTIRRSFRQTIPSFYGTDDMLLLDLTGNADRKMYMNPFDSRQSLMMNDHDPRHPPIGFGEGMPPRLLPKPNSKRTLKIQEDTGF